MQGQVNALYGDRGTLERISLRTLLQKKSETLTYEEAAEIQAFWALMRLKILTIEWEMKERGFWGKVSSFLLGFWIFDLMGQLFNRFYFLASRAIRWLYVTSINLATQSDKTQKIYVLSETSPEEARLFLEQEHQKNQPVFTRFYAQDTRLSKAFLIQKAEELSLYQLYQSYYISQYLSPNPPILQQSYPSVSPSQNVIDNVIDKEWVNF